MKNFFYSIYKHILNFLCTFLFSENYQQNNVVQLLEKHVRLRITDNIWWLMSYRHKIVSDAIVQSKYFNNIKVFSSFAEIIIKHATHIIKDSIIIPIPSSNLQKRIKGYNQTEKIALEIEKQIEFAEINTKILLRNKHTISQTQLGKVERGKNQLKSFILTKNFEQFRERKIVLLDDVCTTGSTLREARKYLKENGFTEVICLAIAHQPLIANN